MAQLSYREKRKRWSEALRGIWDGLADKSPGRRAAWKAAIFILVVFFNLYPKPWYFISQVQRFSNSDALVDDAFVEMTTINRTIDSVLRQSEKPDEELQVIERFVYRNIAYEYDWDSWGVLDYWPSAREVWQRKKEDCDGRAILAVSILRSRGHNAVLVGNLNHMWVAVDSVELLGPQRDKSFSSDDEGLKLALPSLESLLRIFASAVAIFPFIRVVCIVLAALILLFHPRREPWHLAGLVSASLAGLYLLKSWGTEFARGAGDAVTPGMLAGLSLIIFALVAALRRRF